MSKVISLEEYRMKTTFDPYKDPCSRCKKSDFQKINRKNPACTCAEADLWWKILANRVGGRKNE